MLGLMLGVENPEICHTDTCSNDFAVGYVRFSWKCKKFDFENNENFCLSHRIDNQSKCKTKIVPHGDRLGPILGLKRSLFGTKAVPRLGLIGNSNKKKDALGILFLWAPWTSWPLLNWLRNTKEPFTMFCIETWGKTLIDHLLVFIEPCDLFGR